MYPNLLFYYLLTYPPQAYNETLLAAAATEAQCWTEVFIKDTLDAGEEILCTIYGGDFNGDNISPGKGLFCCCFCTFLNCVIYTGETSMATFLVLKSCSVGVFVPS
jgi:hypothetical protein